MLQQHSFMIKLDGMDRSTKKLFKYSQLSQLTSRSDSDSDSDSEVFKDQVQKLTIRTGLIDMTSPLQWPQSRGPECRPFSRMYWSPEKNFPLYATHLIHTHDNTGEFSILTHTDSRLLDFRRCILSLFQCNQ